MLALSQAQVIHEFDSVLRASELLLDGARTLGVPVIVSAFAPVLAKPAPSFRCFPSGTRPHTRVARALCFARALKVTEQYPKGLQHTCAELKVESLPERSAVFEKTLFSMCTPEVMAHVDGLGGIKSAVIFGMETHVGPPAPNPELYVNAILRANACKTKHRYGHGRSLGCGHCAHTCWRACSTGALRRRGPPKRGGLHHACCHANLRAPTSR